MANVNKTLADELNQPTSFPTARSNKKSEKPNKAQNPSGLGFLKNGFFRTLYSYPQIWLTTGPDLGEDHHTYSALEAFLKQYVL